MQSATSAEPGARAVFFLAWPMALKAIFLHGTIVIDGYLVSSLGEVALAALGLAAASGGIVLGVIFAFSHAMQIRTAQAYGTREEVFLKSVLASGLFLSGVIGVSGVLVLMVFGWPLLKAIAPDLGVANGAWAYLTVFTLVIMGEAVGQCLSSYFNGCGRTKLPLLGYCLSVPINIGSSIILIHGLWGFPAFGVAGAAMGSALGVAVQAMFLTWQAYRLDRHLFRKRDWRQATFFLTLKRHVLFSLPIAATFISAVVATHVCTMIYANMPLNAFAAMTLIAPWVMVAGQISMQWTQATGILIAQLLGQGAPEESLDRFLGAAWRGAFATAGLVATVFAVLCVSVDQIYPDLNVETREILKGFLPVLLILPVIRATNAICGNTLRASGDTIYVMHIFLWSQWAFRVPATALGVLYFEWNVFFIVALLLAEEFVKFPAFHRRLFKGDWKRAKIEG